VKEIIAVIPARGGSKELPGKNMRKLTTGKTLIANSVLTARAAGIDMVFVSTDCPSIADEAAAHGAHVIHRPPQFATDTASSESVLQHALADIDMLVDTLVFLQCTGPWLTSAELRGALHTFEKERADSVFTAVPFHGFIWNSLGEGCNHNNQDESRKRRQDLPSEYLETGEAYILNANGFKEHNTRFFGRIVPFIMDRKSFEIDDAEDLLMVNAALQARALQEMSQ
jgi:N-acylneuraminate cytidylyltransferase